jgi:hypothetical protein
LLLRASADDEGPCTGQAAKKRSTPPVFTNHTDPPEQLQSAHSEQWDKSGAHLLVDPCDALLPLCQVPV